MIVIFAENLPPAVRGKLKLWTIEPSPGCFVGGISDALAERVASNLFEACPEKSSMLIIRSQREAPGYVIKQKIGTEANQKLITLTGLQLMQATKLT